MPEQRKTKKDVLKGLVRRSDLLVRPVGLDLALFDPAQAKLHILNPSGAAAWMHIEPTRTFTNIVEALLLSFPTEVTAEQMEGSMVYFLGRLKAEGLIVPKSQQLPARASGLDEKIRIPDREISRFNGYTPPNFKTFTLQQLSEALSADDRPMMRFADWLPVSN